MPLGTAQSLRFGTVPTFSSFRRKSGGNFDFSGRLRRRVLRVRSRGGSSSTSNSFLGTPDDDLKNQARQRTPQLDPGSREQQLLGGFSDLESRLLSEISGLGDTRRQQINEGSSALLGSSLADLQRRGLASSSLNTNVRESVEKRRQQQLGGLEENLALQRANIIQGVGGDSLGFQQSLLSLLLGQQGRERLQGLSNQGSLDRLRLQSQLGLQNQILQNVLSPLALLS